jgi:hypothetical protein
MGQDCASQTHQQRRGWPSKQQTPVSVSSPRASQSPVGYLQPLNLRLVLKIGQATFS